MSSWRSGRRETFLRHVCGLERAQARAHEPPCRECQTAHADYQRQWRRRTGRIPSARVPVTALATIAEAMGIADLAVEHSDEFDPQETLAAIATLLRAAAADAPKAFDLV